MKKAYLFLAVALMLILPTSTIAVEVSEPGVLPIVDEPVTLTCMICQTVDIIDFQTNAFSLWMEDQTGVHIEYEQVPSIAWNEKLATTLASGDLPDFFLGNSGNAITTQQEILYGQKEGYLIPLNDLIEKYGIETKRCFAETPIMEELCTNLDGAIYSLPTWCGLEHTQVPQRAWINTYWLEKLGLEVPETLDELVDVLRHFVNDDPNGNGIKDEVGIIGTPSTWNGVPDGYFISSFTYYDTEDGSHLEADEDGKLQYIGIKDEYRAALRFLNQMYEEGLYYENNMIQTADQIKQIANNPDAEVVGFLTTAQLYDVVTVGSEYYKHFDSIAPVSGPNGVRYSGYLPYSGVRLGAFAISDTCQYPEVAFRWADYAYTYDASIRCRQGVFGEDWRLAEEGELDFEGRQADIARLTPWLQEAQNNNWGNTGIWYETSEMRSRTALNDPDTDLYSPEGLQKFWHVKQKIYWDYLPPIEKIVPPLRYTVEEADEAAVPATDIKNVFDQYKAKFITGDVSLDDDGWNEYLAALENAGLDKWLDIQQAAYDRWLTK